MSDDTRLLVKVATLYYKSHLSQHEIAERLGISRQSAGRLLQRAQDLGIVRIEIHSPLSYATELEVALEETFQLSEALVVSPRADTNEAIKDAIGEATAEFVHRRIKNGDILGIVSGSSTLRQFAYHLKPARIQNLTVVALDGTRPSTPLHTDAESIVRQVAQAFGGKLVVLPAPSFVDRADIKASLLSDSSIGDVLKIAYQSNIALFGIGVISQQGSLYKHGYVDSGLLETILSEGGVGEIVGHAYDIDGNLCSPEISDRTIAVDLPNLRAKEISVAAAGGLHKLDAIWGALRGKYCNVLVTDDQTATALLERQKSQETKERG